VTDEFNFKVGDKIIRKTDAVTWVEILYVGQERFFCRSVFGSEGDYSKSDNWQLYTPPEEAKPQKTKLVSPSYIYQDISTGRSNPLRLPSPAIDEPFVDMLARLKEGVPDVVS
jgi:hypothetical protein